MYNITKLSFVRAVISSYISTYISAHQTNLSSYKKKIFTGEVHKKARETIEEKLLRTEINTFIKVLVKKDTDFSYVISNFFRSFDVTCILDEMYYEVPDRSSLIDAILGVFIVFRFNQVGNTGEGITSRQAAKIAESIASKIEPSDEFLDFVLHDPSIVAQYIGMISEKTELPNEVIRFANSLNTSQNNNSRLVIKDIVTANILLDIILSRDNHTKRLDYYRTLKEIITETLDFADDT